MPTAVRCGTLIDGTGTEPVRGATIVFEGDTIIGVDRDGQVPRDADGRRRRAPDGHARHDRLPRPPRLVDVGAAGAVAHARTA